MPEVSIGLRYDEDAEEVQVYAVSEEEEEILGSSGKDYFKSWVETYNEKHPEVKVVVEEVKPAEVITPVAAGPAAVETPPVETVVQPVVDKPEQT
jgi:hypothetical protein